MSLLSLRPVGLVIACAVALTGCAFVADVPARKLSLRYVTPAPPARSAIPLVLVYDQQNLPNIVQLSVPKGLPDSALLDARALVTEHLRNALGSLFEQVTFTHSRDRLPANAVIGTVRFVDIGLVLSPSGHTVQGVLEWSVTLTSPSDRRPIYHWGERIIGDREAAGAFGRLDPEIAITGAIESSLRTLLKDMETKNVIALVYGEPASAPSIPAPAAPAAPAAPSAP